MRRLGKSYYYGTAILVIAKVFETGVRLQQDRSLTL